MSGYTKGPWSADLGEAYRVMSNDGSQVAIMTHLKGRYGLGGRRESKESASNARLIAAAPDLLDALKGLAAWADGPRQDALSDLTRAREAIAKAEAQS